MRKKLALFFSIVSITLICILNPANANTEPIKDVRVTLVTNKGDITLSVFASKTPVTAANFLNLAQKGYYNGVTFHRVIKNFMIQTGDPTGTGMGSPGYMFEDEIVPSLKHDAKGVLSMARTARPGTNGSQFFITHKETPHLDGQHTVFGKVIEGIEIVDKIEQGDKIQQIKFIDSPEQILKAQEKRVAEWNKILDSNKNKAVLPASN